MVPGEGGQGVLAQVILVVLALFWVVVLVPPLLRARAEHVSRDSIRDFSFKIGALGSANAPYRPAPFRANRARTGAAMPMNAMPMNAMPMNAMPMNVRPANLPPAAYAPSGAGSERSALRRRQVFSVLGIATVVTLMLAMTGTPGAWPMFALSALLLVAYVGLVAYLRPGSRARVPVDRLAQVRYLPPSRPAAPAPQYAYRRTS
jgi:hypothetical protein